MRASLTSRNTLPSPFSPSFFNGEVVGTQYHILCRNGNRTAVRRLQQVVCSQHEESCLSLSLCGKGKVNSHLVTIEVGVERSTDQRVKLDSTAFNEYRLECLDTKSVKCRRTVQQYGVILDNTLQCIPDLVLCRSINLLAACLIFWRTCPVSTSLFITKGLNSSRAISLGRPH